MRGGDQTLADQLHRAAQTLWRFAREQPERRDEFLEWSLRLAWQAQWMRDHPL